MNGRPKGIQLDLKPPSHTSDFLVLETALNQARGMLPMRLMGSAQALGALATIIARCGDQRRMTGEPLVARDLARDAIEAWRLLQDGDDPTGATQRWRPSEPKA